MDSKKKNIFSIVVIVFVSLLSLTFWLYSNGFLNSFINKQDETQLSLPEEYNTFPVSSMSYLAAGKDKQWRMQLFQGFVNRYDVSDGNDILYLDMLSADKNELLEVKIMLKVAESNIPKNLNYDKDGVSLSRFKKEYVNNVTFYPNVNKYKFGEPALNEISFEQFKTDFPQGTRLSFMGIKEMPTREQLTQKFCDEGGLYFCLLTELSYKYSGNMAEFWEMKNNYDGIVVPFEKYLNGIEELK